jgi:hypothetical protein
MPTKAPRGIGAVYGTSRERPFDRWFRYPAGFSPEAFDLAAEAIGDDPKRVVDPFCGSAVAAANLAGREVVGIEAHPLVADLAATKFATPPDTLEALRKAAEGVAEGALGGEEPPETSLEHALVQRCFEPEVLRQLVGIRQAIAAPRRSPWRRYLRWALLGTLRDVATVKVGWPYQRPGVNRAPPHSDPVSRFRARAEMIATDLEQAAILPQGKVVCGDSRSATTWKRAAGGLPFDACVTSPPYLNNFDYADATRLELYFMGFVSSWGEMSEKVRSGMIVATTQQSARGSAKRGMTQIQGFGSVAGEVEKLTAKLVAERAKRSRGKEYDQVLPAYFADLAKVLTHLHGHLRTGAIAAWIVGDSAPYGVYVDTPQLLAALATDVGFVAVDDIVVRSRGLRWRKNGTRHQVPLSERLITLKRL